MSLLIATEQDHRDARAGYERLPIYKQRLQELHKQTDENGQFKYNWEFQVVDGFFVQSDEKTDDLKFHYGDDFGIQKPWDQIVSEIEQLNRQSADVQYKLLFLARHGQGYHNVVVRKYGPQKWREKWHKLGRDGDMVYAPDPELTEVGINQGKENNEIWNQQVQNGCPIPSRYFVSPLQRSCMTLLLTMKELFPENYHVLIVEKIREIIGYHLCNKRATKTEILAKFGPHNFLTEPGFPEEDELHTEEEELFDDHCIRINEFLQQLFNQYTEDKFINVTSHGGTIKCFLAVIGHRNFTISTGGMIPVVIKATKRTI